MSKDGTNKVSKKDGKTRVVCIVDKSGSMSIVKHDTIGGFNEFIGKQKGHPGEALFSLVLFDTEFNHVYTDVDIQDVQPLTEETYTPSGCTALLDAMGNAMSKVGSNDRTLFVVLTDGLENSSREYKRFTIKNMVESRKAAGDEFVFLAANQDAVLTGETMGIDGTHSRNFIVDSAGVSGVLCALSSMTSSFRSGTTINVNHY